MNSQFPILDSPAPYFNHAAVGPWPRATAEAASAFADENMHHGSANYMEWLKREERLRRNLARLTGASSGDDIALLKNTTEGICLVAAGLDWQAGQNVVLPADEFPSNRLPWLALAGRGVKAREVDIRAAGDAEQALLDAMDHDTRLLTVSSVQWTDGFRLDLERLGRACHERGVLFFVDAIQQLGALPLDVEAAHIDFLAADAHKWLLGPEGIAVFYCREERRPELRLQQHGWHMVDRFWDFDRDQWEPSSTALRFEAGTPNSIGQAALDASVSLFLQTGMDAVSARVLDNTAQLIDGLQAMGGVRVTSRTDDERRSGIVAFTHDRFDPNEIYRGLQRQGVSCAMRGGAVRLSPHYYQGKRELEAFFRLLHHIV
jgi:selenocysteine lyase/cysteine desulfurase